MRSQFQIFWALALLLVACGESAPDKYKVPIVISLVEVDMGEFARRQEFRYHVNVLNTSSDTLKVVLGVKPVSDAEGQFCMYGILNYELLPGQDSTVVASACGTSGPPSISEIKTNLRDVWVNGEILGIEGLDLSTVVVENNYEGVTILEPAWSGLGPMAKPGDYEPMSPEEREEMQRKLACSKMKSKMAVEKMCKDLNYMLTDIRLNDKQGCRHQWMIQGIEMEHNASFWCAVNTDGSSGEIEITEVECN